MMLGLERPGDNEEKPPRPVPTRPGAWWRMYEDTRNAYPVKVVDVDGLLFWDGRFVRVRVEDDGLWLCEINLEPAKIVTLRDAGFPLRATVEGEDLEIRAESSRESAAQETGRSRYDHAGFVAPC